MTESSPFLQDLVAELDDPEFAREFALSTLRIRTIDDIVNALDDARTAANLTKADIARAIGAEPAVIRRLFSAKGNPTIHRLAEIAGALGLRVVVEPMRARDVQSVAAALGIARPAPAIDSLEAVTPEGMRTLDEAPGARVKQPSRRQLGAGKLKIHGHLIAMAGIPTRGGRGMTGRTKVEPRRISAARMPRQGGARNSSVEGGSFSSLVK